MTVLVTGGAGFIGSHLAEQLVSVGKKVRVVDNLSSGKKENIPSGVEFQEADFSEADLEGVDYIYHLAAKVSVPQSVKWVNLIHALFRWYQCSGCSKTVQN